MDSGNAHIPIYIIVGAARSGTTYLASLLISPDICYVEEPNIAWMKGHASQKFDVLVADDAKPKNTHYIRNFFSGKLAASGASICLEKTPANCLRLNFIQSVFPEAKYIFLERDQNDIALSAFKKWTAEEDKNTERLYGRDKSHRVRQFWLMLKRFCSVSVFDVVHYIPKATQEILFLVFGVKRKVWGPRYNNIFEDLETYEVIDVCKKQALVCQEKMNEFRLELPPLNYLTLQYEEIKNLPDETASKVWLFMGLSK